MAPPYKSPSGNSRTVDDSPEKMANVLLREIVLLILHKNTYIGANWRHLPLLDLVADLSRRDLAVRGVAVPARMYYYYNNINISLQVQLVWGVAVPARMIVHGDGSSESQVDVLWHLLFGFLGSRPAL